MCSQAIKEQVVVADHVIGHMCVHRRAIEEHRSRAAQAAALEKQRGSWAVQAAAELAQAELAGDGDGAYQGAWTFLGSTGQEMGPYVKSELEAMFERYAHASMTERLCKAGQACVEETRFKMPGLAWVPSGAHSLKRSQPCQQQRVSAQWPNWRQHNGV